MFNRNDRLGFAPLLVVPADHDVEAPVAALFFRFYQAQRLHVEEIMLHPADFFFAETAALQVNRNASQMGGSGVALGRSRIAIVSSQLSLDLHSANSGVDLDLVMEAVVVRFA